LEDLFSTGEITCVDVGGEEVIEHEISRRGSRPGLELSIYADNSIDVCVSSTRAKEGMEDAGRQVSDQRTSGRGRIGCLVWDCAASGVEDAHCNRKIVLSEQSCPLSLVGIGFLAWGVFEVPDSRELASLCTPGEYVERFLDLAVSVCEARDDVDVCAQVWC
jgi:hypothetical protein